MIDLTAIVRSGEAEAVGGSLVRDSAARKPSIHARLRIREDFLLSHVISEEQVGHAGGQHAETDGHVDLKEREVHAGEVVGANQGVLHQE